MLCLSVLVLIREWIIVTGCTMAKQVSGTILMNGDKRPSSSWIWRLPSLVDPEQFFALVVSVLTKSHKIKNYEYSPAQVWVHTILQDLDFPWREGKEAC